ncbi:hypothetical protein ACFVXE_35275 [Streptomyces sp. NPDC058231]|uniref:hypothetical protein n=1 Tax=Streptomyces sp. NPDC058231 TaxID=3346392 RepID=UPI0036E8CACF
MASADVRPALTCHLTPAEPLLWAKGETSGFKEAMARSGAAFAAEPSGTDPSPKQRAAEQQAHAELQRQKRGHAA